MIEQIQQLQCDLQSLTKSRIALLYLVRADYDSLDGINQQRQIGNLIKRLNSSLTSPQRNQANQTQDSLYNSPLLETEDVPLTLTAITQEQKDALQEIALLYLQQLGRHLRGKHDYSDCSVSSASSECLLLRVDGQECLRATPIMLGSSSYKSSNDPQSLGLSKDNERFQAISTHNFMRASQTRRAVGKPGEQPQPFYARVHKLSRKDLRLIGSNLKLLLNSPPEVKSETYQVRRTQFESDSYDGSEEDERISDDENDVEETELLPQLEQTRTKGRNLLLTEILKSHQSEDECKPITLSTTSSQSDTQPIPSYRSITHTQAKGIREHLRRLSSDLGLLKEDFAELPEYIRNKISVPQSKAHYYAQY
ncbi:hypothetical protein FGO68_gene2236 [Halteria grandinella]|uniref:Uncharacterized protein n=1 Tax=Halteria grandinella TaxID=5974 RepID=A0A8J8T085_HALGN|nr:hypothetical protein FGO68_gene2236 [Halteria grandinella]